MTDRELIRLIGQSVLAVVGVAVAVYVARHIWTGELA